MTIEKLYSCDLVAEEVDEQSGLIDGEMDPLIVTKVSDDEYTVLDGCHRLNGLRKARQSMVTCIVLTAEEVADDGTWEDVQAKAKNI